MNRLASLFLRASLLALAGLLLLASDAAAIVPVKPRPPVPFSSVLPYLLLGVAVLALVSYLVWRAMRVLVRRLDERGIRRPILTSALLFAAGVVVPVLVMASPLCRRARAAKPPAPPADTAGAWPTFMGGAARTGCAPGARGPAQGKMLWAFSDAKSPAAFSASPTLAGGRIYVGSDNCKLYCLDARTGQAVWEFKAACEIFASPVVADGRVFAAEGMHQANAAKLYCLDAATGTPEWSFPTTSHIEFSPTLFEGKLYFGAGGDGVYCVDPKTGRQLWRHPGVHVDMPPAVTPGRVVFGSAYGEPAFYAVDPRDGKLLWKRPTPLPVCGTPSTDGDRFYCGIGNGNFQDSHAQPKGAVWCLSLADGSVVWTREVKDAVLSAVALADGSAYFGSRDGHLYCVDAKSGQPRWSFKTEDAVVSSPAVASGRVYFGSNDGHVYCLDAARGSLIWKYDTSGATLLNDARVMASPVVGDGRIFVGSLNCCFFCLGEGAEQTP